MEPVSTTSVLASMRNPPASLSLSVTGFKETTVALCQVKWLHTKDLPGGGVPRIA